MGTIQLIKPNSKVDRDLADLYGVQLEMPLQINSIIVTTALDATKEGYLFKSGTTVVYRCPDPERLKILMEEAKIEIDTHI